jgi:hypothetical protein
MNSYSYEFRKQNYDSLAEFIVNTMNSHLPRTQML